MPGDEQAVGTRTFGARASRYDREAVLDLWAAGRTGLQIDRQLGYASGASAEVARQARAAGDPRAVARSTGFRSGNVTAWHFQALVDLAAGDTNAVVAARYGRSPQAVHNMWRRAGNGGPTRKRPREGERDHLMSELPALLEKHKTFQAIGEAIGCSRKTVARLWSKAGLEPRKEALPEVPGLTPREVSMRRHQEIIAGLPQLLAKHRSYRTAAKEVGVDRKWLRLEAEKQGIKPTRQPRTPRPKPVVAPKRVVLRAVSPPLRAAPRPAIVVVAEAPATGSPKVDRARAMLVAGKDAFDVRAATGLELWRIYALRAEVRDARRMRA